MFWVIFILLLVKIICNQAPLSKVHNNLIKTTENKSSHSKFSPCIWKICSKPLKKEISHRAKNELNDFQKAVSNALENSNQQAFLRDYFEIIKKIDSSPEEVFFVPVHKAG